MIMLLILVFSNAGRQGREDDRDQEQERENGELFRPSITSNNCLQSPKRPHILVPLLNHNL